MSGKILSSILEPFIAVAKPHSGVRAVSQDVYASLKMFVPVGHTYFADLVEGATPPPRRVTETWEASSTDAVVLESFRTCESQFRLIWIGFDDASRVTSGISDSHLSQVMELERAACPFKVVWRKMWATACKILW